MSLQDHAALSPRETQCLSLLAHGYDNAGIAEALGIRLPTVAMHLVNARNKLRAGTREQAVAIAVSHGLVTMGVQNPPAH